MDEEILNIFRARPEGYVSGGELSRLLGVSRAAIWKHIQKLRNDGYQILALPYLGYRLVSRPDKLLANEVSWHLETKIVGRKILSYELTTSTMDIAYQLGMDGAVEGTVIFAEGQTEGRGRMGRAWVSPKGKGIYISVILRPDILSLQAPQITLMAAVGISKAIRDLTGLPSLIKWPNDIIINGRKVCGILTEMCAEMDCVKFLILGIGINVSAERGILPEDATSIEEELDRKVFRIDLARGVLRRIEEHYLVFKKEGFSPIIEDWRNLSATLGNRVKVIYQHRQIEGQAIDLDPYGALVVREDSGFIEKVVAGDVVIVR